MLDASLPVTTQPPSHRRRLQPTRPMKSFALAALTLLACAPAAPTERYGFITRLGSDTDRRRERDAPRKHRHQRRRGPVPARPAAAHRDRAPPRRRDRAPRDGHPHAERAGRRAGTPRRRRRDRGFRARLEARRQGNPDARLRDEWRDGDGARPADVQPLRAVLPGGARPRRGRQARRRRHGPDAAVLHRPRVRPLPAASRNRAHRVGQPGGDRARLAGGHRRGDLRLRASDAALLRRADDVPGGREPPGDAPRRPPDRRAPSRRSRRTRAG